MMRTALLCLALLPLAASVEAASGRYFTWVDDQGQVHNTFVDGRYSSQQQQAARSINLNQQARDLSQSEARWNGNESSSESKRRYFTWVDAKGNLQNSFYANDPTGKGRDYLLPSGGRSGEYIDAEVLEGRGYSRPENGPRYYTWTDENGRMHNAEVPPEDREARAREAMSGPVRYTEGREVKFTKAQPALPGLDGQKPSDALAALLKSSGQSNGAGLYDELTVRCCGQMREDDFTALSTAEPRYEEINKFSPSFDFPMGRSFYTAVKLPNSYRTYGLRVRSFANKSVVYPSLLFLDENKRPTRLVSDAVYQLHGETWYRYAFIEGTVPVEADKGERYVLILTTDEDRSLQTLDNKPFKRPLEDLAVNESGMKVREHAQMGSFELAVVK